jgi:hypothetical protein
LRKQTDAEKTAHKIGILPNDPEIGFAHLWGSPSAIGNRTDLSIKQSFDFPTAYLHKKQLAKLKDQQSENQYQNVIYETMYQSRILLTELIYTNKLLIEYAERIENAEAIVNAYKLKYETGHSAIFDVNKAQWNLIILEKEIEKQKLQKRGLLNELEILNGGIQIEFDQHAYDPVTIPEDFESWWEDHKDKDPIFIALRKEIEIQEKDIQLASSMKLPKFSAGYMSEKISDERFQGVTLGVSIPLWGNKNTMKYAKAKADVIKGLQNETEITHYFEMKLIYENAVLLKKYTEDLKADLHAYDHSDLLKKALDTGEINLINYLTEISYYYRGIDKILETERDFRLAILKLNKYDETI